MNALVRLPKHVVALFRDNPVLEKDATTALRAPIAPFVAAGVALTAWLVATFAHVASEPSNDALAQWSTLSTSGRAIVAAVVGVLLALETFVVPAMAASAIAGERERGTLPLLQVSALSPARIVAGKLAAIVVVIAPLMCVALPLLTLGTLFGGVSFAHVALGALFLAFHAIVLAAVGIGASSVAKRARAAAPLAMVFSLVPSLLLGIPAIGALVAFVEGDSRIGVGPIVVAGGFAELLIAIAALLLARDQLSPRSAPRWPLRSLVVGAFLVVLPVVAAVALHVAPATHGSSREDVAVAVLCGAALLMLAAVVVEVSIADLRAVDRLSRVRQAIVVAALASVGLVLARLVPAPVVTVPLPEWIDNVSLRVVPWAALAIVALYMLFVASTTALVGRIVRHPIARVVLSGMFLGGLFFVPFILHELRHVLPFGQWPLGATNPVIVAVELERASRGVADMYSAMDVSPVASALFFVATSTVMLLLARRRAR